MRMVRFIVSFVVASIFLVPLVNCELRCYDCDPNVEGRCISPDEHRVISTVCTNPGSAKSSYSGAQTATLSPDKSDNSSSTALEPSFECYSLYFRTRRSWDAKSGVYRGCAIKGRHNSVCDYLGEEVAHLGDVLSCSSCSGTINCNDKIF